VIVVGLYQFVFGIAAAFTLLHSAFVTTVIRLCTIRYSRHPAHAVVDIHHNTTCQGDVDDGKNKNKTLFHKDKDTS